jgi:biopolymer transport protein ExbD
MPGPRRRIDFLVWACFLTLLQTLATADEFDRLGEADLSRSVIQKHAHKQDGLGFRELAGLPAVLRDARSSLLIVVTDQGNVARLIASPGFRKVSGDPNTLTPTLVVDRFETRDPANRAAPVAHGKEAWLFDGFGYDLDAGQVVPIDMGADIRFVAAGPDDGRLSPVGKAELFVVESLPPAPKASADRPSEGRVVRPADYNGTYRLAANGVWSGLLDLKVDPEGVVSGKYQSDSGGAAHPVTGKAAVGGDHGVAFTIEFPRTRQEYNGWLWGEGKNVIAGSVTMINQSYSFIAIREGTSASLATVGLKITGASSAQTPARTLTLDESGERFLLDAEPNARPTTELVELLKTDPDASVVVKVPAATPFERVRRFLQLIEDAGVRSIRFVPSD